MAQRVAAIFANRDAAERAADALAELGADREHVSILGRDNERAGTPTREGGFRRVQPGISMPGLRHMPGQGPPTPVPGRHPDQFVEPAREVGDAGAPLTTTDEDEAAAGAAEGAAIGVAVGIAAAALALMVPGVGLILASGPLAWALGGAAGTAAAGAIAGGVYGSLRDIGIEDTYARGYEERIRTGEVLMTALVPTVVSEDRILDVLSEHGAEEISFADDTSIARAVVTPSVTEARIISPDYQTTDTTDRDTAAAASPGHPAMEATGPNLTGAAPPVSGTTGQASMIPPTATTAAGALGMSPDAMTMREPTAPMDRTVATGGSYAESPVGATATTGAEANVTRGEKEFESDVRDRAADRTGSTESRAAAREKSENKLPEETVETEDTIEPRQV